MITRSAIRIIDVLRTGLFFGVLLMATLRTNTMAAVMDADRITAAVIDHVASVAADHQLTTHGEVLITDVIEVPLAPFDFPETSHADDIILDVSSSLDRFFSPRALIRVKMSSPDGRVREIGVPVKISLSKSVWVAKTTIMPGETLSKKELDLVPREITNSFDQTVGTEYEIDRYAARILLRPGQMLTASNISKPLAVRRLTDVRIVMTGANGLRVMLSGKSMEDGHVGQLVRVRNKFNRDKYYTAKVIGENQVQVGL